MLTEEKKLHRAAVESALSIDGWLTRHEAVQLYECARTAIGPIVEIGSWRGRSTAALALGSMNGNGEQVFAVDSFVGVPELDRLTAQGANPGWSSSSPEILRSNLDSVGVNGLVRIVPKDAHDALGDVPSQIGVLFIDGDHSYEGARRNLEDYIGRVIEGGYIVLHDVHEGDPDVVRAVDDVLMPLASEWRPVRRADSMVVFRKQASVRHKVFLAVPGRNWIWDSMVGLDTCTIGVHEVTKVNSGMGWDDMNRLWVNALNASERGMFDRFAIQHSDQAPQPGWIDTLSCEMDDLKADFVSTVSALKDIRGLTSCGVGTMEERWDAYRRFTMHEVMDFPETFSVQDTPHPDKVLLHNSGCILIDLTASIFHDTDENGYLKATFSFPIAARRLAPGGPLVHCRESEDWYFSRQMHLLGAKSYVTRKVGMSHIGDRGHPNNVAWGSYKDGDEDTKAKWAPQSKD